jgi:hypothetical protein
MRSCFPRLKRPTPLCISGPPPVQRYPGFMHILLRAAFPSLYRCGGTSSRPPFWRCYDRRRQNIVPVQEATLLTGSVVWRLNSRACHAVLTLIESAGVHQSSGRSSVVQIRNGTLAGLRSCPECRGHSWLAGTSIQATTLGMRLHHLQASSALCGSGLPPDGSRRAGLGSAERAEPDKRGRGGVPGGVVFGDCPSSGGGPRNGQFTGPSGRSPFPASTGFREPGARARGPESVPAPERLSTSAGSVLCPTPEQGQDLNPLQRER